MDPRGYTGTPFNTSLNRQNCLNQKFSTPSPLQGWGAPARGYSPYTCNFTTPQRSPREDLSPAQNYRQRSPRTNQNQFKYPSPNEPRSFRSPFSPPGTDRPFQSPQYRGRGRKSFNNYFGKATFLICEIAHYNSLSWRLVRVACGIAIFALVASALV